MAPGKPDFRRRLRCARKVTPSRLHLIGEEPHIPYNRPPLSKGFVLGTQDAESIELRPVNFYKTHQINLLCGERVVGISRAEKQIEIASGGNLVLRLAGVGRRRQQSQTSRSRRRFGRRTLFAFARRSIFIKKRIEESQRIVVIGGGFIGLELAAVASALGKSVTVIEALPRVMARVVAPIISEFFPRPAHQPRRENFLRRHSQRNSRHERARQ